MARPLVEDDSPEPQEQPPPQTNELQPIIQKSESVFSLLGKGLQWLGRRKMPDTVKNGARGFGEEIWFSKDELARRRRQQGRFPDKKATRWTATPFRSFGPKEKKKKSKL